LSAAGSADDSAPVPPSQCALVTTASLLTPGATVTVIATAFRASSGSPVASQTPRRNTIASSAA
jgi:hypothetical protein